MREWGKMNVEQLCSPAFGGLMWAHSIALEFAVPRRRGPLEQDMDMVSATMPLKS